MRNRGSPGNSLVTRSLQALAARLPEGWTISSIEPARRPSDYKPDGVFEVRAPDGGKATLLVEAKSRLTAQQAADLGPRLSAAAQNARVAGVLVVTPFLSELARDRLRRVGVSYLDLTGNTRIAIDRPAVLIETQGAGKDPSPPRRGVKSLKGPKAARIVRALCDWRPPVGVRELARRARTDPGYTTRVLTLLEDEDVIQRDTAGEVVDVRWQDLLRRWTQDYDVSKTNRAVAFLAPRGVNEFLSGLGRYPARYALTGSLAVPAAASTAASRLASCYLDNPEGAAESLDLRPAEAGANVLLLEPFDPVVFERTRRDEGLDRVAVSQCVVDLLTGTGREPVQADALLAWMAENEDAWRA